MLLCVQVMQINNNEFCWKKKKKKLSIADKQKICKLAKQTENHNQKHLVEKIYIEYQIQCKLSHLNKLKSQLSSSSICVVELRIAHVKNLNN